MLTNDLISRDACLLQTARNEKNVHAYVLVATYIISVGILNSHKFRDSSWLLNWYVSLSLIVQASSWAKSMNTAMPFAERCDKAHPTAHGIVDA